MNFDEWKEQNLNRFTCSHEVFVAYEAWQQQQTRINELEDYIQNTDSQKRIDELESQLEDATMFHYKRGFQDAKEIHMRKNAGLLANIKVLEAQLEVADIRPMEESEYLERIETLKDELEDKFRIICNLRSTIAGLTEKLDIERNNKGVNKLNDECLFDTQEEHDRYELEQAIMSCWGITDDLHLLADAMESGEHKRMHHEMLLNLSQLYELKFQRLFKEFNKFTGCSYD